MKLRLIPSILFLLISGTIHAEEINSVKQVIKPVEEIIIKGVRPGPPLWRIENAENTLWVFAIVFPIPKSLEWDPTSIEHIISESQEYLPLIEKRIVVSILNPFKAIGMARQFKKIKKISNGGRLNDYLSAQEYDQFLSLRAQYAPNNKKIEKLMPIFAAEEIFKKVSQQYGFIGSDKISNAITKLAKNNKLAFTKVNVREKVEPKPLFEAIENLTDAEHSKCLSEVMKTIDNEIESLINYAILWADGDAQALVNNSQPRPQDPCIEFFIKSDQAQRIITQSEKLWLNAAQKALEKNRSTFAVMELSQVIEPDGLLNQLVSRGYKLIGPVRNAEPNAGSSINLKQ